MFSSKNKESAPAPQPMALQGPATAAKRRRSHTVLVVVLRTAREHSAYIHFFRDSIKQILLKFSPVSERLVAAINIAGQSERQLATEKQVLLSPRG